MKQNRQKSKFLHGASRLVEAVFHTEHSGGKQALISATLPTVSTKNPAGLLAQA